MAIYVSYSCPHCGSAAVIPFTRIEWAEVTPCPSCHRPVQRTKDAFAANWAVCCMFYAAVFLLPSSALLAFVANGGGSLWLKLLTAVSLGMIGVAAVGVPAYIYGYFFAGFGTGVSTDSDHRGFAGGVCSICGADLRGNEKQ